MNAQQIDFYRKASKLGMIADSSNPLFVFQQTSTDVLAMMLTGKIDPLELLKMEMSNRGIDETGKFVGFKPKTSPEKLEASKKSIAKKKAAKKTVETVETK